MKVFVVLCNEIEWCEFIGCASTLLKAKNMAQRHMNDHTRVPLLIAWVGKYSYDTDAIVCRSNNCGDEYEIRDEKVI